MLDQSLQPVPPPRDAAPLRPRRADSAFQA